MNFHNPNLQFTDIPGIRAGHATLAAEPTGCTTIICENGAIAGVDVRGSAPGTREVTLLQPTFLIRHIHALVLSGGSAFGLRTADGVMRYLHEKNMGFQAPGATVPIVPAAVIYDLNAERNVLLPDAEAGYEACINSCGLWQEGRIGAGAGARVGKILGLDASMAGGLASAVMEVTPGVYLGALAVANAFGDIINPRNGKIVAGARNLQSGGFADTLRLMREQSPETLAGQNTTLAVIVTNAGFDKEQVCKIAAMAQNGIGRVTRPAHSMFDGDIVFALSTGEKAGEVNLFGELAAQLISEAILKAVR